MKNNVVNFALAAQTGKGWSVKGMLKNALSDISAEKRTANRALVIFLDDTGGQYNMGFSQSGLSLSQCVALLEIAKAEFIKSMGS